MILDFKVNQILFSYLSNSSINNLNILSLEIILLLYNSFILSGIDVLYILSINNLSLTPF